ncbi:MAG: glycosyltransferase, partial [Candidatus Omnitrophica bacterium]|nr:glycosyltransferase [Candidatus Omnitrophota bacterium]
KPLLPIESGMELRVYNLLRPLCFKHEISLLCFAPEEDQTKDPIENLRTLFHKVELVPREKTKRQKPGLLRRVGGWIWPPADFLGGLGASINMKNAIQSFIKTNDVDLVHIAGPNMISYFLKTTHIPIVFDSIDDPSLYFFRSIKQDKRLLEKAKRLKDWLVSRNFEKRYYRKFKEIIVSSSIDGKIINSFCPQSNVTVIPNGTDCHYLRPVSSEPEEPILVFSGVMDYEPNILAMTFFCKSIFPLIKREIPNSQLVIVGKNPTHEIVSLEKEMSGIKVTGFVNDLRPYFARSKVYVCPLKSGAGIKNKILEAWAAGLPIAATSLGCAGVEISPGEDILIADDIHSFAKAVVRLLQDENLRKRLVQKGRKKVVEKYDWESKAEMLEKVYFRAMKNSSIDADSC